MVTSLVLRDCYNIGVNSSHKIQLGDNIVSIDKDIPFIRYRFDEYTDEKLQYIAESVKKFERPIHLAEVPLNENTASTIQAIRAISPQIAIFVYTNIDNNDVENPEQAKFIQYLGGISGLNVDRIMLKDKSTNLDFPVARKLIASVVQIVRCAREDVGLCSSPFSFTDNMSCITAVKARELMTKYGAHPDVALPTSNHQSMNTCGCIRYFEVTSDLEAPADTKVGGKAKKEKPEHEEKEKAEKPAKVAKQKMSIHPGMFRL